MEAETSMCSTDHGNKEYIMHTCLAEGLEEGIQVVVAHTYREGGRGRRHRVGHTHANTHI